MRKCYVKSENKEKLLHDIVSKPAIKKKKKNSAYYANTIHENRKLYATANIILLTYLFMHRRLGTEHCT